MEEQSTAALDDAAAEATAVIEEPIEEPQEEQQEKPTEEVDEDGLPLDHAARSDLGRKVAATHRRLDAIEANFSAKIDELVNAIKPHKDEEEIDPYAPVTFKDLAELRQREAIQKQQFEQAYNGAYVSKITEMAADMEEDYYNEVIAEMKNVSYTPSKEPAKDAELNFLRAERRVLRKKRNPLKGKSPGATLSNQTVDKQNKPLPKLDDAAEDYLAYIKYTDGKEAALKARKEVS